jgi:transcriptional regulator with AbiEi antitoxin domain of type IV toxin-antitoxin system
VVTRGQLLELGFRSKAIQHRIDAGRLHPVRRGVYAVGRPELTLHGRWMAAVLCCGREAALSHESAAALWGIRPVRRGPIEVSVPAQHRRSPPGMVVHRRAAHGPAAVTRCQGIPVTSPVSTLIDIATRLDRDRLEAAINEADKHDLIHPDELRSALDKVARRPRRPAAA